MLEKATSVGREAVEHAARSGSPDAEGSALHALSKALHYLSTISTRNDEKARLLQEALVCRQKMDKIIEKVFTYNDWVRGVNKSYQGLIKEDLEKIENDETKKKSLLESAINDLKDGISHCGRFVASRPVPSQIATLGLFEDSLGALLNDLYALTKDNSNLIRAVEVHEDAVEQFNKAAMPSRAAESRWKAARNQHRLGETLKAADSFERASEDYMQAAKNNPKFSEVYDGYACYMKAWSEIERASSAHGAERYLDAAKHYEKTEELLQQTKSWSYLALNFGAWSLLEHGEDLSRRENSAESIASFQKAADHFKEAKRALETEIPRIQNLDEQEMAKELSRASVRRMNYCMARTALEEARMLDRKGTHQESARKYDSAVKLFEKIMSTMETDVDRKEIEPILYMCQAWQKMKLADTAASPKLYREASELFLKAKEHSVSDKSMLLASGNGAFCRALENGTEFESTREKEHFLKTKQYLESAANYYLKAGFESASVWTNATEMLFDAYNYMIGAETEPDPNRRTKTYLLAEKCLERSARLYEKAGYTGKHDEALRTLNNVEEKRRFTLSLTDMLSAPTDASSPRAISAPRLTVEQPVGLLKFEHAFIEANLIVQNREVLVGESFNIEIQLLNLGKDAAFLLRAKNLIPNEFVLVQKPKKCTVKNGLVDLKGRRLEPLESDEITMKVKPTKRGKFTFTPAIQFVDEAGNDKLCELEQVTVTVRKITLPGRLSTGHADLDNLLFGGIPENYAVILASPSSDEREQLVRKFLVAGAKAGQTVYYITAEVGNITDLAEEFQSNFSVFVCNPLADGMIKNLPNVFILKGVESLTDIDIALVKSFRNLGASQTVPRRFCITIISDVLLQHHSVITRKWLSGLLPDLKSKGFTTLAVINPDMHPLEEVQAVLGLFEGEIKISEKETVRGIEKVLRVRKLYNQRYLENELTLTKEGLES